MRAELLCLTHCHFLVIEVGTAQLDEAPATLIWPPCTISDRPRMAETGDTVFACKGGNAIRSALDTGWGQADANSSRHTVSPAAARKGEAAACREQVGVLLLRLLATIVWCCGVGARCFVRGCRRGTEVRSRLADKGVIQSRPAFSTHSRFLALFRLIPSGVCRRCFESPSGSLPSAIISRSSFCQLSVSRASLASQGVDRR